MSEEGGSGDAGISEPTTAESTGGAIGEASDHWGGIQEAYGELQLSGDASLGDFKSFEDFAKSYSSAQDLISRSIRIPTTEASEEQHAQFRERLLQIPGVTELPVDGDEASLNRFYQKIGRPETAGDYRFETPEGATANEKGDQIFAELAHRAGLTQAQADILRNASLERNATQATEKAEAYDKAIGDLRREWGEAFDERLGQGRAVLDIMEIENPGLTEHLESMDLDTDPVIIKAFQSLYRRMGEPESMQPGDVGGVMTPSEARAKLDDILNNPDHPARNPGHPGYERAQNERIRLYDIAGGRA